MVVYKKSSSFIFEVLGTYTVTLTVEDEVGNHDTDSVVITVEELFEEETIVEEI